MIGGLPGSRELRFEKLAGAANHLVHVHRLKLGRGHLGKVAEASDDGLQVGKFGQQGCGALAENLVKLGGITSRARSRFSTVI